MARVSFPIFLHVPTLFPKLPVPVKRSFVLSVRSSALLMLLYPGTDPWLCSWIWWMQVNWEPKEGTSCGVRREAVLVGRQQEGRSVSQDLGACGPVHWFVRACVVWEFLSFSELPLKPFSSIFKSLLIFYFFPLMKCVFPFAMWPILI